MKRLLLAVPDAARTVFPPIGQVLNQHVVQGTA